MAIVGMLVHVLPESAKNTEETLKNIEGITTYGIHQDSYIVAVGEARSSNLEDFIKNLENIDDVLAVYLTSLSTEDEEEND